MIKLGLVDKRTVGRFPAGKDGRAASKLLFPWITADRAWSWTLNRSNANITDA